MSSYMKAKIIKRISSNYTFFQANSKLRQIWTFLNECFQTEFAHCVLCDVIIESEVIANDNTPTFSDTWRMRCHYSINETAGKQFPTYLGLSEIQFPSWSTLVKQEYKTDNKFWRIILIGYWRVTKKVIVRDFF